MAIWVAGIGLGIALGARAGRAAISALALMAALSVLGMLGDAYGWAASLRVGIDAAFLLAAVSLALAFGVRLRGAGEHSRRRPWRIG